MAASSSTPSRNGACTITGEDDKYGLALSAMKKLAGHLGVGPNAATAWIASPKIGSATPFTGAPWVPGALSTSLGLISSRRVLMMSSLRPSARNSATVAHVLPRSGRAEAPGGRFREFSSLPFMTYEPQMTGRRARLAPVLVDRGRLFVPVREPVLALGHDPRVEHHAIAHIRRPHRRPAPRTGG